MPDPQPAPDLAEVYDTRERDVLYLLTEPEDNQPLWSIEDLALEVETPTIIDFVNALCRAGLVRRTSDGYVFATRPAVRLIQLVGRAV
jgi:Mn-dependent DtxR family transcriptional regulator